MRYDLEYLKIINETLYDSIMNEVFNHAQNYDAWLGEQDNLLEYDVILSKYEAIFDKLKEYRDSSKVLENEVNVIINQLDKYNIIYFEKISGVKIADFLEVITEGSNEEMKEEIRSYLLYFIYFWELYHDKDIQQRNINYLNPKGKLSIDLLDKPLSDIFNSDSEIMGLATYHVFDDDVDFNALSIAQVKDLFLNNLYRAYHSQNRFSDVMDIIKNHIGVMRFKGYEKYINNIKDKNEIIELYNTIRNRNTDLEKMKEIIISKYKYKEQNSINTYSKNESRSVGL